MVFKINYSYYILVAIFLIIQIIIISILNRKVIFKKSVKNEYQSKFKKISKNYHDILVELSSKLDYSKYQIIQVLNFEEMLDLQNELRIPILFYENKEKNETSFHIIHNNTMYLYVLK